MSHDWFVKLSLEHEYEMLVMVLEGAKSWIGSKNWMDQLTPWFYSDMA